MTQPALSARDTDLINRIDELLVPQLMRLGAQVGPTTHTYLRDETSTLEITLSSRGAWQVKLKDIGNGECTIADSSAKLDLQEAFDDLERQLDAQH